jgi:hypothetical protein
VFINFPGMLIVHSPNRKPSQNWEVFKNRTCCIRL